ncbi:MAG: hypothetical protein HUJ56_09140 [Erysipelotrichaceae bacterium]|nr:hypothetical protein [Erysipelotrichaceae bacterium]
MKKLACVIVLCLLCGCGAIEVLPKPKEVVETIFEPDPKRIYLDLSYSLNHDDKALLDLVAKGIEDYLGNYEYELVYTHALDSDVSAAARKNIMKDRDVCISLMMSETDPLKSNYAQIRLIPVTGNYHEESVKLGECLDPLFMNTYHYDGLFYYYLVATPKGNYYEELVYSNDLSERNDETHVMLTDSPLPTVMINLGTYNEENVQYVSEHAKELSKAIAQGVIAYLGE